MTPIVPCIYCGSNRPPRKKREHVMPRLLGTFRDNWTADFVCDECNAYFGQELEVTFGRDSMEALQRLQSGVKRAAEHRDLHYNRVTMLVEAAGDFQGAKSRLGPDAKDGVQPVPFPQIGFRPNGTTSRFQWILEEDLSAEAIAPFLGPGWEFVVLGDSDEERQHVLNRAFELGLKLAGPLVERNSAVVDEKNQTAISVEATFDIPIQRTIAKIAMNFAAYVLGADFVRGADFDAARRFIRFGERPGYQVVEPPSNRPILADDSRTRRQTTGHVIAVEWRGRDTLVIRFSPFNFITYDVVLCPRFRGVWRQISIGFVFDHEQHTIYPLTSTRLVKPPWARRRR